MPKGVLLNRALDVEEKRGRLKTEKWGKVVTIGPSLSSGLARALIIRDPAPTTVSYSPEPPALTEGHG